MSANPVDVLFPWRDADRRATRIAVTTVSSTLAAMLVAATLPLWVRNEPVHTALLGYHNGTAVDWLWILAVTDVWWAVGLVLVVPALGTVYGAFLSRRRLSDATRRMPAAADFSTIGPTRSAGQRSAQVRSRQGGIAARQRRFTEQNRYGVPVATWLGATFAYILGGWFLIGVALDLTGATTAPLGAWVAAYSWWLLVAALIVWALIHTLADSARKARVRRRAGSDQGDGDVTGPPGATAS